MNRIRINLLPQEILEKRKAEKILSFLIIGIVGIFTVAIVAFLVVFGMVDGEANKLEDLKTDNFRYEQEIAKIADFEGSKIFVEERLQVVNAAIAGKYSWSKWLNNLSLLIPNEVWLDSLDIGAEGDVAFAGTALADTDSRQLGQKSVAKWLVRLSQLDDLSDVWLDTSKKSFGAEREPLPENPLTSEDLQLRDQMEFKVNAKLTPQTEDDSDVSAPPNQGGQP